MTGYRHALERTHFMITSRLATSITIVAILICAALHFAGNGLFQTLLPIRATQEGYSSALIGWIGTAYFGGFTIGCFLGPKIIMSVGHARAFADITALLTATFLAFPLFLGFSTRVERRVFGDALYRCGKLVKRQCKQRKSRSHAAHLHYC
ncbi:MAG: MFS family permease [Octadecabacter sp.]|jgi:MFS family permease